MHKIILSNRQTTGVMYYMQVPISIVSMYEQNVSLNFSG